MFYNPREGNSFWRNAAVGIGGLVALGAAAKMGHKAGIIKHDITGRLGDILSSGATTAGTMFGKVVNGATQGLVNPGETYKEDRKQDLEAANKTLKDTADNILTNVGSQVNKQEQMLAQLQTVINAHADVGQITKAEAIATRAELQKVRDSQNVLEKSTQEAQANLALTLEATGKELRGAISAIQAERQNMQASIQDMMNQAIQNVAIPVAPALQPAAHNAPFAAPPLDLTPQFDPVAATAMTQNAAAQPRVREQWKRPDPHAPGKAKQTRTDVRHTPIRTEPISPAGRSASASPHQQPPESGMRQRSSIRTEPISPDL